MSCVDPDDLPDFGVLCRFHPCRRGCDRCADMVGALAERERDLAAAYERIEQLEAENTRLVAQLRR